MKNTDLIPYKKIIQPIRKIILTICGMVSLTVLLAQKTDLTMQEAITLARQKSFEAFQAKNIYVYKALDFQTSRRLLYPKARLSLTPSDYNRSIEEQWNSENEQYKPYEVQRLTSRGNFSLTQYVGKTGGTFTLNSYLNRYQTFKAQGGDYTTYISNPFTISYSQNFAGINSFKWRLKIDSVQFEQAKKQYLEDVEATTIKTISLFFNLLNTEMNYKIALLNKNNADTLFLFGKQKLEIGAITRDNYLRLQLKKVNAKITLESRSLALDEARLELNNFLELPRKTQLQCHIPEHVPDFEIPVIRALDKAFENNPDMVSLKSKLLNARRAVKSAKANRFSANFSATVGLNQNQDKLANAYKDLKNQESLSFTVSIPILDWGDTRRSIAQARLNEELAMESARKERDAIELQVINMVNEFNIKHKQVMAAAQADSIAQITYQAVKQQFMLGKASILDINSSYTDMQSAQNNYLNSLDNYWTQLYSIRKLCLYDFQNQVDLDTDFDQMLEANY